MEKLTILMEILYLIILRPLNMDHRGCLSLCSWNCNGLPGKILELREFVKERNLDIILLQETHLDQSKSCKIPNYTIFRNDFINPNPNSIRNIRGTAICLRNNLNATLAIPPLSSLSTLSEFPAYYLSSHRFSLSMCPIIARKWHHLGH